MANQGIKPTDFPSIPTIDGTEELYTQTGGVNGKFLVSQIVGLVPSIPNYSTTPIKTGRKWVDGKDEWEVVLNISNHISGNNYKHNLGVAVYISIEGFAWSESSPSTIYALNRNDSTGTLNKLQYRSLTINDIEVIKTDAGIDKLQFLVKYIKA